MRPVNVFLPAAAVVVCWTFNTLRVLAKEENPAINFYDPKEIKPEIAKGGLKKLIDRGILSFKEKGTNSRRLRTRKTGNIEGKNRNLQKRAHHGGTKPTYDDYYSYYGPEEPTYDDYYYYSSHTTSEPYDDTLSAEEVVFLAAFQDNRFSSAEPIYVTPNDPDLTATGNIWLYVDVPLQEESGIDIDPLLGFAQGTCQGIFSNEDGYCFFTYEFFDGLEVIASITAEGTTRPNGPSILTVTGGTGELAGVSGEVSLIPASLDTSVSPPVVVDDGSIFLGNPVGYYMEAVLYIQYRVADLTDDVHWDDAFLDDGFVTEPPVVEDPEMDIEEEMLPETPTDQESQGVVVEFGRVVCPGLDAELDYCDCDYDCEDSPTHRCGCDAAWEDTCCGTAF